MAAAIAYDERIRPCRRDNETGHPRIPVGNNPNPSLHHHPASDPMNPELLAICIAIQIVAGILLAFLVALVVLSIIVLSEKQRGQEHEPGFLEELLEGLNDAILGARDDYAYRNWK